MNPSGSIPLESLMHHATGLRALARGLLSDEGAAEEVVQDTWLAALGHERLEAGRVGGWLRRVARKKALKRLRTDARRTRREELAAHGEALASAVDTAAEREVLRRVVDAVLALDEPYQSVVLMRYWQDLPPREIARRRGLPIATVRSQLHRALARLRGRLDTDAGDERGRWALALAVAIEGPTRAPLPAGGLARGIGEGTTMLWKLSLGGLALATAALLALRETGSDLERHGDDERGSELARASVAAEQEGGQVDSAALADEGDSRREPIGSTALPVGPVDPTTDAGVFSLTVRVFDEHDLPVQNAQVIAAPPMHPWNLLGRTDDEGVLRASWSADARPTSLRIGVARSGGFAEPRELDLRPDAPVELRLAQSRPMHLQLDLQRIGAVDGVGLVKDLDGLGLRELHLAPDATVERLEEERIAFVWPLPLGVETLEELVDSSHGTSVSIEDAKKLLKGLGYVGEEEAPAGRLVVLTGTVLDADGSPARNALVRASAGTAAWSTSADQRGAFELRFHTESAVTARAGGGELGLASADFALEGDEPAQRIEWNPHLDRGLEVRGRLLGPDGGPLAGWRVEFVGGASGSRHEDETRAGEDGSFAIPNLPAGAGTLLVRAHAFEPLPRRAIPGVHPGGAEIDVALEESELADGSVSLALTGPDGERVEEADAFLQQLASRRGSSLRWDAARERFHSGPVPPGRYRVQVGTLAHGYLDLGEVEVVAGEDASLGVASLPAPGTLELVGELARRESEAGSTLFRRVGGLRSDLRLLPVPDLFPLELPAGEYELRIPDPAGIEIAHTATVASERATVLGEAPPE